MTTGRSAQKRQQSHKAITRAKRAGKAAFRQPQRTKEVRGQEEARGQQDATLQRLCNVVHQFGLVGGTGYGSKEERLEQLLERIPSGGGPAVVFVDPTSAAAASATVERSVRKGGNFEAADFPDCGGVAAPDAKRPRKKVATPCRSNSFTGPLKEALKVPSVAIAVVGKGSSATPEGCYQYVINYNLPSTSHEYIGRLAALNMGKAAPMPQVSYTLVEERQLKGRNCQQLAALLRRMRAAANADEELGGQVKATELDSALEQLDPPEDEEEEEEEGTGGDDDDSCTCPHCQGFLMGGTSYHGMSPLSSGAWSGVEVVRVPLKALEDLSAAGPFIAPRFAGHVCSMICLHSLNAHTPWDGREHLFVPPELRGIMRVVLVLADDCSWHHYPDQHTLSAGGVSWLDILDVESMNRADALLDRLVEYETDLLGGHSSRVVLMGCSQGGGQSMLRFLRSRRRLGGYVGSVCHVPTSPHTPRESDPLLAEERPLVNCDQPVRLQAGELDCVFPPRLVLRDAERLRKVGAFTDVHVEVTKGLTHDGYAEGLEVEGCLEGKVPDVPELLFVQKHLPLMLSLAAPGRMPEEC